MSRNKNVEILRASAIITVMIYHFYVISGKTILGTVFPAILSMGGELGVTMFFVLSGFGIASLLKVKTYSYTNFIVGRLKKLVPEYFLCLIVLLLLTNQSIYLNKEHVWNVFSHFVFLHSFSLASHGAINGSLWTMSVMMQFYLLSYGIYKLQKKSCIWPVLFIGLSLLTKYYLYHIHIPNMGFNNAIYYFFYGRQIYAALDNFIIGMLTAEIIHRKKSLRSPVFFSVISLLLLLTWAYIGYIKGIYFDTIFSVMWHFICAVLCGCIIFTYYCMPEFTGFCAKAFHWVARNNYGIYLWHLVLANNILLYCTWAQEMTYPPFAITMVCLSCILGCISTHCGQALCQVFKK